MLGEKPGEHRFIVTKPGHGYRFVADVRPFSEFESSEVAGDRPHEGITSLAVLRLFSSSGDADAEYLCEGIAESLINSFTELPKLRVAQQQKSFRYKGADVDAQQVANELRVRAVLTGKIAIRGDTLVVSMGLIDAERDAQIWGQQFTKKTADILRPAGRDCARGRRGVEVEARKAAEEADAKHRGVSPVSERPLLLGEANPEQSPQGDPNVSAGLGKGSRLRRSVCRYCRLLRD